MVTKTKKQTPIVELDEEDEVVEEEKAPEETVTFKLSHFYSVLVVLAFAVGILVGYVAWGRTPQVIQVAQQPAAQAGAQIPQPTPVPVIYNIETKGAPSLGPADAPIVIVEFSDYQCPYCGQWHDQVYTPLLAAYPDKIRFVYRNFPLPFHQNALASAEAALCAGDQNAYWKFHDVLFANKQLLNNQAGTVLDQAAYNKFASDLGLDVTSFETCMTSHKHKKTIEDDIAYANSLQPDSNGEAAVGGTPTFFINGHRLGGAYPIQYFKQIINAELVKN
jgi:protein-disulfide isomerase